MPQEPVQVYTLTIHATVSVTGLATPVLDYAGNVVGFALPDGRAMRPVIALEVEKDDRYNDISASDDMAQLGFFLDDFDRTFVGHR